MAKVHIKVGIGKTVCGLRSCENVARDDMAKCTCLNCLGLVIKRWRGKVKLHAWILGRLIQVHDKIKEQEKIH